jgi:hypothetical protein
MMSVLEPADQVRAFRAKYGFGGYSRLVYPTDPAVAVQQMDPNQNPNNAIRAALDPARQKAYDQALEGDAREAKAGGKPPKGPIDQGCGGAAGLKYYGTGPSKDQQAASAREYAKFQNDPAVIKAAQKYGDCAGPSAHAAGTSRPSSSSSPPRSGCSAASSAPAWGSSRSW